jgi:hypothetical protein
VKALVLMAATEGGWDAATAEQRQEVMDAHTAFHKAVAERATMLAGEALAESREARTLRHVDGAPVVTDGPYAEAAEQLTGFYVIDTDDLDDLLGCVGRIASDEGGIEVRAYVERGGM